MKLVLDTNIFISSFFWGGHPRDIMTRIIDGTDLLFISDEILSEIYDVMLRPKFKINLQYVQNFVHSIEEIAQPIHLMGIVQGVCRDSDDDKIWECALGVSIVFDLFSSMGKFVFILFFYFINLLIIKTLEIEK
ncbi:MAG: putative toxin-antitoxin system toxin component, PIN family [Dysgonamonadaceae bacterium]|jgi:putative PIN family toxin of toxin-antitoxin system|nr:putative toxin-antitoxin system toxin component, PIN family [Dysgonamonadaceae bacterium]